MFGVVLPMAAPFVLRAPASIHASEQEVAMQGSPEAGTNDLRPQRTHGEYLHHDRPNGIETEAPTTDVRASVRVQAARRCSLRRR